MYCYLYVTWKPPIDLERVHSETLVHSRRVAKDGSQDGLEHQTKVHEHVLHSLLEHGKTSCFTNDEIGPLYDDNGDKESRVASVLEDFAVLVGPLLAIRVLKIIDSLKNNEHFISQGDI